MQSKIFVLLIFIMAAMSQEKIKMDANPIKENVVTFNELATLMDEDEGFYDRTYASISPKGDVVVADAGNKQINVYDKNYKFVTRFGKEGNGPGEIDRIGFVKATSDRIYVSSFRRMIIFTYQGKFISEINLMEYGSSRQIVDDNGVTLYFTMGNPKFSAVFYSADGEEIKKVTNTEYVEPKEEQRGMRMVFFGGNGYLPYNGGYINSARGEYGIEVIGSDFKVNKVYTRSFTRIPRNMDDFQFSFKAEGVTKKEQEKMRKAAQQQMMQQLGKFEDDVAGILGTVNDYIFARVAHDDEEVILIDVISPDMEYYTVVELDAKDYESSRIEEGKLIVNYKNDDDGPYVKIFDINMI